MNLDARKVYKKIGQLLESYDKKILCQNQKLAVPLSVPTYLVLAGLSSEDPKQKSIGNMTTIAFYYLLRGGEYTLSLIHI